MVEIMTLAEQVKYHLENNFTVPLPEYIIDPVTPCCVEAIEACKLYDVYRLVELPPCVRFFTYEDTETKLDHAEALEIVDHFKLYGFLPTDYDMNKIPRSNPNRVI